MPGLPVVALLSALAVTAVAVPALPTPTTDVAMPLVFDPARSQAHFKVRMRILPAATGHFLDVRGQLQPDGDKQRVEVEVDGRKLRFAGPGWMNKVTRSDDFLAVEKHPRIFFRSDAFVPALLREGGPLRGELTLRGETKPVTFKVAPAACDAPGRDCEIVVTGRVSRQAFGMHAYRLTVRDAVDFEFHVRLLPDPGADVVSLLARAVLLLATLHLAACAGVSPKRQLQAQGYADQARSAQISCASTPCAPASPLLELGDAAMAASAPNAPRHSVMLLDAGLDSLLSRVHLIASAKETIDLQTFHFEQDDSGRLVLDALMDAARRGVKVRLLMDQLSGLDEARIWSHLAGYHRNFELRMYNPLFRKAQFGPLEFTAALVFQFGTLNRRMHNKAMVVDGTVGIVGGRNIQDEYFDWHPSYDYRDRDILVAGPAAVEMTANFDAFWEDERTLEPAELSDVASLLIREKGPVATLAMPPRNPRVEAMARAAADPAAVYARLAPYRVDVGRVDYVGDLPNKHDAAAARYSDASQQMRDIVAGAREELLLQTPYLVLSRPARQLFREMQQRGEPPRVRVSTNSLAATDAFPAYAMSHKYKRLYLRELGFEIHEYKPFPDDAPIDPDATGAMGAELATEATTRAGLPALPWPQPDGGAIPVPPAAAVAAPPPLPGPDDAVTSSPAPDPGHGLRAFRRLGPVPLKRAGLRIGLHAKSLVVDRRIAVVGSHNFDPRSDEFNTESMVVVHDAAFAARLAESIERDMAPGNAWVIAPKEKLPILWGLNYNLGKLSEKLPVFDIWPLPYATSYELKPGCAPRPPTAPDFHDCYDPVGDFPEVNLGLKGIYTRVLTVFGAGLIPIL